MMCVILLCRAVDCGAGIGRITEGLLCKMFKKVDLVRPHSRHAPPGLLSCLTAGMLQALNIHRRTARAKRVHDWNMRPYQRETPGTFRWSQWPSSLTRPKKSFLQTAQEIFTTSDCRTSPLKMCVAIFELYLQAPRRATARAVVGAGL